MLVVDRKLGNWENTKWMRSREGHFQFVHRRVHVWWGWVFELIGAGRGLGSRSQQTTEDPDTQPNHNPYLPKRKPREKKNGMGEDALEGLE